MSSTLLLYVLVKASKQSPRPESEVYIESKKQKNKKVGDSGRTWPAAHVQSRPP